MQPDGYSVFVFIIVVMKVFPKKNVPEGYLTKVKKFRYDIIMTLGRDKCTQSTKRERDFGTVHVFKLDNETMIHRIYPKKLYKWTGINDGREIQKALIKDKIVLDNLKGGKK